MNNAAQECADRIIGKLIMQDYIKPEFRQRLRDGACDEIAFAIARGSEGKWAKRLRAATQDLIDILEDEYDGAEDSLTRKNGLAIKEAKSALKDAIGPLDACEQCNYPLDGMAGSGCSDPEGHINERYGLTLQQSQGLDDAAFELLEVAQRLIEIGKLAGIAPKIGDNDPMANLLGLALRAVSMVNIHDSSQAYRA